MIYLVYILAGLGALVVIGVVGVFATVVRVTRMEEAAMRAEAEESADAAAVEQTEQPDQNIEPVSEAEEAEALAMYRLVDAARTELEEEIEAEYQRHGMALALDVIRVEPAPTDADDGCTCGYADGELWIGLRTSEDCAIWDPSSPSRRAAHTVGRRIRQALADRIGFIGQRAHEEGYARGRAEALRQFQPQAQGDRHGEEAATEASG